MSSNVGNGFNSGMKQRNVISPDTRSEIVDFFDGRTIFLTGATGFIGSVLLEQLLRCCPGVERVYILLRKKRGVDSLQRKNEIINKKIFSKLTETNPKVFEKLTVVPGDLSFENLGISPETVSEMAKTVTVVFHSAADLTFNKPLSHMITQNCLATEAVIKLCRKFQNSLAFIYVSSITSSFWRNKWEETFPSLQVSSRDLMEAARRGDEKKLSELAAKCQPPWPNTYAFSKAITEDFLHKEVKDFPFVIVRPTMVIFCYEGPLRGYIPDQYAYTYMFSGITRGYFRVFYGDPNQTADIIPCDTVANTMLTAAWYLHVKKPKEPFVINNLLPSSASSSYKSLGTLCEVGKKYPPPQLHQEPYLLFRKSYWTYWPSALVNHYLPALYLDAVRLVQGKKAKFVKMYMMYDLILYYSTFIFHSDDSGKFPIDNFVKLMDSQNKKDRELFPIDLRKEKTTDMIKLSRIGASYYESSKDHRTLDERVKTARRTHIITTSIKWTSVVFFMILFGLFISEIFKFIL